VNNFWVQKFSTKTFNGESAFDFSLVDHFPEILKVRLRP